MRISCTPVQASVLRFDLLPFKARVRRSRLRDCCMRSLGNTCRAAEAPSSRYLRRHGSGERMRHPAFRSSPSIGLDLSDRAARPKLTRAAVESGWSELGGNRSFDWQFRILGQLAHVPTLSGSRRDLIEPPRVDIINEAANGHVVGDPRM